MNSPAVDEVASLPSEKSLELKPPQSKPGKWDYVPPRATPARSENSTQTLIPVEDRLQPIDNSSPGVWLATSEVIESPTTEEALSLVGAEEVSVHEEANPNIPTDNLLDEMIKEARKVHHLPLDEDDDSRPGSRDGSKMSDNSGDESDSPPKEKLSFSKKSSSKGRFNQENFSCMKGGTTAASDSNPNTRTIAILQEMADFYGRINDTWRPIAYRKAITTLRQQSAKITTSEEASKLPFIGLRLANKIEEIVLTDRLQRLENAKLETSDHILQKFMDIYGVGFSQASKWLHQGFKTLEDLKAKASLSENQRLGIDHYDDLLTRIPRNEMTKLVAVVSQVAAAIDPTVNTIAGGSYRRGAASSGDIDFILTKRHTSSSKELLPFLTELVQRLTSTGFLVAALAVPRSESGSKWHGCCVLPGASPAIWRRIDFLLVPSSELGAALIYFTGNDIFNRSIRLLASRKGMRLNQRGLYKDVMRGAGRQKITEGVLIEGAEEKRIFEALGVPWRPPHERIC